VRKPWLRRNGERARALDDPVREPGLRRKLSLFPLTSGSVEKHSSCFTFMMKKLGNDLKCCRFSSVFLSFQCRAIQQIKIKSGPTFHTPPPHQAPLPFSPLSLALFVSCIFELLLSFLLVTFFDPKGSVQRKLRRVYCTVACMVQRLGQC
jgi:hypothetical protein